MRRLRRDRLAGYSCTSSALDQGPRETTPMIHVMLPVQYLRKAGAHRIEPQKRLMLAVLQTVIDDCQGSKNRRAARGPGPRGRKALGGGGGYLRTTDRWG